MSIHLESTTLEPLIMTVTTTVDPSGTPPEFSITPIDITKPLDDPAAWANGTWFGTWDADKGKIQAVTPQLGRAPAALETTEGVDYRLWIRWTAGSDQPVRDLKRIYVR